LSSSSFNGRFNVADTKLLVISDFNASLVARYAANASPFDGFTFETAPFGQVYQTLSQPPGSGTSAAIIWTTPEGVIPTFAKALDHEQVEAEQCLTEVDQFADLLGPFAEGLRFVFLASWILPPKHRGYGMLDWRPGIGLANLLARMNLRLAERLSNCMNVHLFDASRWSQAEGGPQAAKMWYAAKVPYRNSVFEHAVQAFGAALRAIKGQSRKLIVLDLDNTLWGNVVGETGWAGVRLGGIDYVGEAFRDFQKTLRALTHRGIQLAIVSKNDESVALQAIDEHPEMLLRRNDFVGWRINWHDKADNLQALVKELNLGLASVVFIDDNPAERDRVRTAFPEVLVPEWPVDPCAYVTALQSLDCFETTGVTDEDRKRTSMYVAERERRGIREQAASAEDWLSRLQTTLRVQRVGENQITRVAQLYNKTNQLNLSTRRMTPQEILAWAGEPRRSMFAISVADRFGDLGLSGIVSVEAGDETGRLVDFILSCRAMGRKVEEAMLHLAATELARLGARAMKVSYLPTERNRPTLDVLDSSHLEPASHNEYAFDLARRYPAPADITIDLADLG
jgi:FkbH-like protein